MAVAGLTMATIKYELEEFNEDLYSRGYDLGENNKDRLFQPILKIGAGYDLELDFCNFFAEGFLNIPANTVGGAAIAVNIPVSIGINAGIRIPLF